MANYANGWICVIRHSLDDAKSNINKIRNECRKAKRDPKDIHIAAILYPNVIDSGDIDKERHRIQPKRQLLSGSVDQVGKDLQEIQRTGVDFSNNFGNLASFIFAIPIVKYTRGPGRNQ